MTLTRGIPLTAHGAIEMFAAPAVMAAPFVFGFGAAATVISVALGVLLIGLALQVEGPRRAVPLAAHAGFDYALAAVAVSAGLTIGDRDRRLGGISLFGRRRHRAGGVDRFNAVHGAPRRLTTRPTSHRQKTHISPPCTRDAPQ